MNYSTIKLFNPKSYLYLSPISGSMIDLSAISSFEEKLLVSLCRLQFSEEQKDLTGEYMKNVNDWSYFTRLANEHGVIALAAYNIKACGLENDIPREKMAILENGYMQSLMRNTWLTVRWKEVNTILTNAGIRHILLKGMALEHTIYGAKGLRQMNDNDIFLKYDDAIKAWYLLQKKGFAPEPLKSPLFTKIMFDHGHHLPVLIKDGYALEIHYKLSYQSYIEREYSEELFSDAVEILVGNTKGWSLPKKRHIDYLIQHFEKHVLGGSCQLRLYTDIILLDETSTVTIPAGFISNPGQENSYRYRKAGYKSNIKSIPAKHRLRFMVGDMFPSMGWMKTRYNCQGWKALLYYPLRVGKIWWMV